jgi:hypothetical protein
MRWPRGGADLPLSSDLIELNLKGRYCAHGGSLYSPDRLAAIIENLVFCIPASDMAAIETTIINSIPPSPGLAPTRDDAVDVKTDPSIDKFHGFTLRGDDRWRYWISEFFEHMFER